MTTFEEFLADLKDELIQYDNAGLIDEVRVYNDVLSAIKKFGLLPLEIQDTVLHVKNGKVKLPDGFRLLRFAIKCEPFEYECEDNEDILQDYLFYKIKDVKKKEWSNCDECNETHSEQVIVEKLYFKNRRAKVRYNKPTYLKLSQNVKKNYCDKGCPNIKFNKSPYEIEIKGNTLYTNFKEGTIYLKYKGLEEDEDGFVLIPDTNTGALMDYIKYSVREKIMFRALLNSDGTTNEQFLYQDYAMKANSAESRAVTDLKGKGIKKALDKYRKELKKEFKTYNF